MIIIFLLQQCHKVWSTGEFHKGDDETNEIYCSMCGDGGDIVYCDYCDKSFCSTCIGRISGQDYLQRLLNTSSSDFCCYLCDSGPVIIMQELCMELTSHLNRSRGVRVGLRSKGKPRNAVVGLADGAVGGGDSVDCGRDDDDDDGDKGGDDVPLGTGGGSGGGKRRRQRKKSDVSCGFSDESSSCSEGKSPEVHTDDVDSSDSALDTGKERKKVLRKKTSQSSDSGRDSEGEGGVHSSQDKKERRKKRKKRFFLRDFELSEGGDSDDKKDRRRKRKVSPHSDSSTGAHSGEGQDKKTHKKRRVAMSLSSDSDIGLFGNSLTVQLMSDTGEMYSDENPASQPTPIKGAVRYKITEALNSSDSSDSGPAAPKQVKKTKSDSNRGKASGSGVKSEGGGGGGVRSKGSKTRRRVTRDSKMTMDLSSDDDFMETDYSLKGRRPKKRKQLNKSFLSTDSDSSGGDVKKGEEEEEEEEGEESLAGSQESLPGKKRRKIRKVFGDAKLANETKIALQEEKARTERLKKRKSQGEDEDDQLVLERDPVSKKALVEVRKSLVPSIKPHQRDGIKFLYNACVENMKRIGDGKATGAILAHCMGLGKTLQVMSVWCMFLCKLISQHVPLTPM